MFIDRYMENIMSLLINSIKDLLDSNIGIKELYSYDFVIVKESNEYTFYSYSSINKYPQLNKAIQEFVLEKYRDLIEEEGVFFIEITNKNTIRVSVNIIKNITDEFNFK